MQITCPHCHSVCQAPDHYGGREVVCPSPNCRLKFTIPTATPIKTDPFARRTAAAVHKFTVSTVATTSSKDMPADEEQQASAPPEPPPIPPQTISHAGGEGKVDGVLPPLVSPRMPATMPPVPESLMNPIDSTFAPQSLVTAQPADGDPATDAVPEFGTNATERSFGVVFTVFYWVLGGFAGLIIGVMLTSIGSAAQQAMGMDSGAFSRSSARGSEAVVTMIVFELLGVALTFYSLLLLVASYGLWTFRRWGLGLAKKLAVISVVLNLVLLLVTIVSRSGIVNGLAGTVVSVLIMIFLFGSEELSNRLLLFAAQYGQPNQSHRNQ